MTLREQLTPKPADTTELHARVLEWALEHHYPDNVEHIAALLPRIPEPEADNREAVFAAMNATYTYAVAQLKREGLTDLAPYLPRFRPPAIYDRISKVEPHEFYPTDLQIPLEAWTDLRVGIHRILVQTLTYHAMDSRAINGPVNGSDFINTLAMLFCSRNLDDFLRLTHWVLGSEWDGMNFLFQRHVDHALLLGLIAERDPELGGKFDWKNTVIPDPGLVELFLQTQKNQPE
jgi:hypothetical protein